MSIRDDPALGGGAPKPAAFPSARRGNHGARQEAPAARRAGRRMRDAVIVYFDAPVVVSIIMVDAHSPMPGCWYEGLGASVIISDLANPEVSAVISREFRAKRYTRAQADKAVGEFESLRAQSYRMSHGPRDFSPAELLIRDYSTKLSAPDALHLASAKNIGAMLATFGVRLAEAARAQGVEMAEFR
jgi:uncharacterized protein